MKALSSLKVLLIVGTLTTAIIWTVSENAEKSLVYASGLVTLDPALNEEATGIKTLFLVLHDEDSPMPMPYGAQKVPISDPKGNVYEFVLTKDNIQQMRPNDPKIPQTLRIKARLDRTGQGGADKEGDLVGQLTGVKLGATGLKIVIDKAIHL
jgi:hypothetical protein